MDFYIGTNSIIFNYILMAMILIHVILMVPVLKREYKYKVNGRISNTIATILIVVIAIFLIIPYPDGGYLMPYPVNYFAVVFGSAWLGVVAISMKVARKRDEEEYNKKLLAGLHEAASGGATLEIHNFSYRNELLRKAVHLMSSMYLLAFILTALIFSLIFNNIYAVHPERYLKEEYWNVFILSNKEVNPMKSEISILLLALIGSFFVQNTGEIMRLRSPDKNFILKRTLQKTRRATESYIFGAHIDIVVGFTFSSIILVFSPTWRYNGIMGIFALVLTSCLADMSMALFGRKWGTKKWKINKDKSYVGSAAGMIVAFLTSFLFVGWFLAIITTLVVLFNDLIIAKYKISDNLSNPVVLGIVYRLLIFMVNPLLPRFWYIV